LLSSLLKDKAEILFSTAPEAGIRLAQQQLPDLILLDVEMPGLNGYEVCSRLKALPATREIPVLFVSGHTAPGHEVTALEAGAADVISKPLLAAVVRARVQTQLSLAEKTWQLNLLARQDGLTGIANRRACEEKLAEEFWRHQRHAMPLTVVMVDIDHFKAYNDHYGHAQGDACLRQVAQLLSGDARRAGELACRYGGEEFVIVLPHVDAAAARRYGEHLCGHVRRAGISHACSPQAAHVTVSLGVSTLVPEAGDNREALLAQAERALHLAKTGGRDRSEFLSGDKPVSTATGSVHP
jgi:diguanylate cyclase (GGDEF)-like protein